MFTKRMIKRAVNFNSLKKASYDKIYYHSRLFYKKEYYTFLLHEYEIKSILHDLIRFDY